MHGDVVDDHVVVNVHREVAHHQEAQAAAVILSHVGLDQVVVDIHRAGALRPAGLAIEGTRNSRQLTGDDDTGAFIVGMVEVDAVVVDRAVGAQAEVADPAAVFRREVAADIVAGHHVAVGAAKQADRAGQVGAAIGEDAVVGDAQVVVVVEVGGNIGRTDTDGAIRAAVVLNNVVGDLQVVGARIGEDGAALDLEIWTGKRAGEAAKDGVQVAGDVLLITAADVEPVDGSLEIAAELVVRLQAEHR